MFKRNCKSLSRWLLQLSGTGKSSWVSVVIAGAVQQSETERSDRGPVKIAIAQQLSETISSSQIPVVITVVLIIRKFTEPYVARIVASMCDISQPKRGPLCCVLTRRAKRTLFFRTLVHFARTLLPQFNTPRWCKQLELHWPMQMYTFETC